MAKHREELDDGPAYTASISTALALSEENMLKFNRSPAPQFFINETSGFIPEGFTDGSFPYGSEEYRSVSGNSSAAGSSTKQNTPTQAQLAEESRRTEATPLIQTKAPDNNDHEEIIHPENDDAQQINNEEDDTQQINNSADLDGASPGSVIKRLDVFFIRFEKLLGLFLVLMVPFTFKLDLPHNPLDELFNRSDFISEMLKHVPLLCIDFTNSFQKTLGLAIPNILALLEASTGVVSKKLYSMVIKPSLNWYAANHYRNNLEYLRRHVGDSCAEAIHSSVHYVVRLDEANRTRLYLTTAKAMSFFVGLGITILENHGTQSDYLQYSLMLAKYTGRYIFVVDIIYCAFMVLVYFGMWVWVKTKSIVMSYLHTHHWV